MSKVGPGVHSSGILMPGPGALRLQALQSNLISLTSEQLDSINRAKRYASEQTVKIIYNNQATTSTVSNPLTSQQTSKKSPQRQQNLVLMCRVYVGNISFELKEESIKSAFGMFGAIKSVNMSWDPTTMKHKGFAFVEFELPEAAQLAIEHMNGAQFDGRQMKVGRPSNMPQAASAIQQFQEECKTRNRIYISNVHADLIEEELMKIFEPLGRISTCKMAMKPDTEVSQHRGYGFVEFETKEAAEESLTMNKMDLGGQTLYVCRATTPPDNVSVNGTIISETESRSLDLDDDVHSGKDNSHHEQLSSELGHVSSSADSHSKVLVLKNMVSADEDLDDSLMLDVHEECNKHGPVTQVMIYIEKKEEKQPSSSSNDGHEKETSNGTSSATDENDSKKNDDATDLVKIFIKYRDSNGSRRAKEALNGRFFGGRRIVADYFSLESFRKGEYSK